MNNHPKKKLLKILSHLLKSKDLDLREQADLIHTTLPMISHIHNQILERLSYERIFRALNDCGYNIEIWILENLKEDQGSITIEVDADIQDQMEIEEDEGEV